MLSPQQGKLHHSQSTTLRGIPFEQIMQIKILFELVCPITGGSMTKGHIFSSTFLGMTVFQIFFWKMKT